MRFSQEKLGVNILRVRKDRKRKVFHGCESNRSIFG